MSQPWQPRYDPGAHQRRIEDGVPPQGYAQQPGWQQPPPQAWPPQQPPPYRQPPRRKGHPGRTAAIIAACAVATFIGVAVARSGGTPQSSASSPPAATGAPLTTQAAQPAPAAASTVTYVVTGSSSADVTYGPAGSDATGHVPMHKTAAIPSSAPAYYAISAQLQGGGTVTCEILVNGKVVSKATATGGYNIAQCEADQNPLTGQWEDTNSA